MLHCRIVHPKFFIPVFSSSVFDPHIFICIPNNRQIKGIKLLEVWFFFHADFSSKVNVMEVISWVFSIILHTASRAEDLTNIKSTATIKQYREGLVFVMISLFLLKIQMKITVNLFWHNVTMCCSTERKSFSIWCCENSHFHYL